MTEPTDDELDAVIAEYRTRIYPQDMHPRFERAIMRAAIAKWGTPPPKWEPVAWNDLTDEDRERAMNSMPGMLEGFTKTWGWLHFAKAIEAICREKNAQPAPAYKDSTPELHVGDSAFESWYSNYSPAHKGDKQRARDAYAAGMGDPLATAAPQQETSPTAGMNIAQRILHVGGRNNAAGYVEFGSIQAVEALVKQVLRDLPAPQPSPTPQAGSVTAPAGQPYGIVDPDYARVFTQARIIAWQYGYACVMHGSFTRDLDLLLVPWTEQAGDNHDQLLKLIAGSCGLRFRDGKEEVYESIVDFTEKPHGRKSCSLFFREFGDRRWIDISIVPRPLYATAPAQTADSALEDAARRTTEQEHAIRQGHEIAASDGYFEARPQIDSNDRRKVFQAGFERGWDAASKQGGA